jgi:hypothetical protein
MTVFKHNSESSTTKKVESMSTSGGTSLVLDMKITTEFFIAGYEMK